MRLNPSFKLKVSICFDLFALFLREEKGIPDLFWCARLENRLEAKV